MRSVSVGVAGSAKRSVTLAAVMITRIAPQQHSAILKVHAYRVHKVIILSEQGRMTCARKPLLIA